VTFYERTGKYDQALECGLQALKLTEDEFGPDDINISDVCVRLGRLYMFQKRYLDAKRVLKRALKITEEKMGLNHPNTADIIYELGCFFFIKPEDLGARVATTLRANLANKNFWANRNWDNVQLLDNQSLAKARDNEKGWSQDKALKWFETALQIKEATLGADHPDVARILNRIGSLYIERTQFVKAEEYLLRALSIRKSTLGHDHSRVAQTFKHMLTLYQSQERWQEAEKCGEKALEIISRVEGDDSLNAASVHIRLGNVKVATSKADRDVGLKHLQKALEIRIKRLGEEDQLVHDVEHLIRTFNDTIPIPPPPPVPTLEELREQAAPEASQTMKSDPGRQGLIKEIANFHKAKKLVQLKKPMVTKKAANLEEKQGWWKQKYHYGGDIPAPKSDELRTQWEQQTQAQQLLKKQVLLDLHVLE